MAWWQRWDHCPCGGYATYANAVVLRDEQRSVCPQATEQLHAGKCRFTAFPRVASWTRKPPTEWDLTVLWVMRIWALPQAIMDYSINGAVLAATHCNLCAIKQKEVIEVHADSVLFNFVSSFAFFAIFSSALLVTFYYHMRLSFVGACVAVGIQ